MGYALDSVDLFFFFNHNVLLYLVDMARFLKSRLIAAERYKGTRDNGHESAVHLVMQGSRSRIQSGF